MMNTTRIAAAITGLLVLTLLCLHCPLVHAHDFWIQPMDFRPVRSPVPVRLLVGEQFVGDTLPRDPRHLDRFVVVGPAGTAPVGGVPGRDPAGYVPIEAPGLYTIGYTSRRTTITIDAPAFEQYLADEGLEHISAIRARRGEGRAAATELFSRCAKSLVAVGAINAAAHDVALGLPLELVAEHNPYRPGSRTALSLRLLYHDAPLPGALVVARSRATSARTLRSRTDTQGRVVFRLPEDGMWLVKAVHMIPAPPGSGADWESLWATLTFELPR
jgi:uncharacterized GH25 family protein